MKQTTRSEMPVSDDELDAELSIVYKYLVQRLQRKGSSFQVAQEAAQEGVIRAWQKAHLWEGRAKLRTFLTRVALRGALNSLRNEVRQEKVKQCASAIAKAVEKRLRYNRRKKAATLSELDNVECFKENWEGV